MKARIPDFLVIEVMKNLTFAGVAAVYRPTPATIRVVTALLGDLCTDDKDCTIPNSECSNGGCICSEGYAETSDRQECFGKIESLISRLIIALHFWIFYAFWVSCRSNNFKNFDVPFWITKFRNSEVRFGFNDSKTLKNTKSSIIEPLATPHPQRVNLVSSKSSDVQSFTSSTPTRELSTSS